MWVIDTRPSPPAKNRCQHTARPTHYYVIHNEIDFKADEIQGVTNALSYMFAQSRIRLVESPRICKGRIT